MTGQPSSWGGLGLMFGGHVESDDPSVLPPDMQVVYQDPFKILELDPSAKPWELRDRFLDWCKAMNPDLLASSSSSSPVRRPAKGGPIKFKHLVLAFRLCNQDLPRHSAKEVLLRLTMDRDSYEGAEPGDIIPRLRPLKTPGTTLHPNVRGAKSLFVEVSGTEAPPPPTTTLTLGGITTTQQQQASAAGGGQLLVVRVTYLMRSTTIKRTYAQFAELHAGLKQDYQYLPDLPPDPGLLFHVLGVTPPSPVLLAFARYLVNCHRNMAARGFFSQRLMEFLGLDVQRYHWEEEARIIKKLDTTNALPGAPWQVVPECWLVRWRKFIQSRDARRYLPPGRIDNTIFFVRQGGPSSSSSSSSSQPQDGDQDDDDDDNNNNNNGGDLEGTTSSSCVVLRRGLELVKDYRVVNYNVWRYWELVYGAGPSLCRKDKDIYSQVGIGPTQAAIRLQCCFRRTIARMRYAKRVLQQFSKTPGAREALLMVQLEDRKKHAVEKMQESRRKRIEKNMVDAITFTQATWRRKKGSVSMSREALEKQKHVQEVFKQLAPQDDVAAAMGKSFVVEEPVAIVSIPCTEEFDVLFPARITLGLKAHPCTDTITFVWKVDPPTPEEEAVGNVPRILGGGVIKEVPLHSVLLAINGYPVTALSHQDKMKRLKVSSWPMKLRFRRPLQEGDVAPLPKVLEMEDETLRLHTLKRRLMVGVPVIKHGRSGAPHESVLYLTESHLFWSRAKAGGGQGAGHGWASDDLKAVSLYELKFCLGGKQSPPLKRMAARLVKPNRCFTIFTEDKDLAIEIKPPSASSSESEVSEVCNLLIWGFSHIIQESRGSLFYVDAEGNPVKRTKPKLVLKPLSDL